MVHLMGGQSVARPALFLFTVPLRTPYDCDKIPGRVLGVTKSRVQSFSAVCVWAGRFVLMF